MEMLIDYIATFVGSKWLMVITALLTILVGVFTTLTYLVKDSENKERDSSFENLQSQSVEITKELKRLTEKSNQLQEDKFELLEEFHKQHAEDSQDIKSNIQDINAPRISTTFVGFENGLFKYSIQNDDTRTFKKTSMSFRTTIKIWNKHELILLERTKDTIESTSILDKPFLPGNTFTSRSRFYNIPKDDVLWSVADMIEFSTAVIFGIDEYRSFNSIPKRSIFYKVRIRSNNKSKPETSYSSNQPKFKQLYY
ncbi:MAG: hypothetical protein V7784_24195 [Oceanospirillaceae bacterium]